MDSINANAPILHPNRTFTSLPPEIRNMIYTLLLIKDKPITVASPRHKGRRANAELTSNNFARLLRVSKLIHNEASSVFYSVDTFVIGNGEWGSRSKPNLHALRAFTARVPSQFLACIKQIDYNIYPRLGGGGFIFGTKADAADMHSISRSLVKHLAGLEVITFHFTNIGPNHSPIAVVGQSERLSKESARREVSCTIGILLKLKSLSAVLLVSPLLPPAVAHSKFPGWIDLDKVKERLQPDPRGIVRVV